MLDQTFGRIFSTQWLVFAILLIVLLGLSEFAWRMGFAHRRQGRTKDNRESSVPSAVLALLGLLLGFSFALAVCHVTTHAATSWFRRRTQSARLRAERTTAGATSVRANFFWFPISVFRRETHFHFVRAPFLLASDRTDGQARRRGRHNRQ
jgi:hypothetical protein